MMSLWNACRSILGIARADEIINDMGLKWAVVAAIADAKKDDNPEAIAALHEYLRQWREPCMDGSDAAGTGTPRPGAAHP